MFGGGEGGRRDLEQIVVIDGFPIARDSVYRLLGERFRVWTSNSSAKVVWRSMKASNLQIPFLWHFRLAYDEGFPKHHN